MIALRAPHPTHQTLMLLPNPQFGDGEAPRDTVQLRRAMDGTVYTYVRRTGGRRELNLEFLITRMKALELIEFIRSYQSWPIQLTDHLAQVWVGNITSDIVDMEMTARAPDKPGREMVTVRIQFEGVLQ